MFDILELSINYQPAQRMQAFQSSSISGERRHRTLSHTLIMHFPFLSQFLAVQTHPTDRPNRPTDARARQMSDLRRRSPVTAMSSFPMLTRKLGHAIQQEQQLVSMEIKGLGGG